MDSKLIVTIIVTIIGSGIIAPFSKAFFDKIFADYQPDVAKINLLIRRSVLFTFRYVLPVANLVYIYLTREIVDKYLVLMTAFIFSVLVFNILGDILVRLVDNIHSRDIRTIDAVSGIISLLEQQQKLNNNNEGITDSLVDLQKKQLEILGELSNKSFKGK